MERVSLIAPTTHERGLNATYSTPSSFSSCSSIKLWESEFPSLARGESVARPQEGSVPYALHRRPWNLEFSKMRCMEDGRQQCCQIEKARGSKHPGHLN